MVKQIIDEKKVCNEYMQSKIGIETLAKQCHVGKLRIKSILLKNGIEFKKKGGQSNNETFIVDDYHTKKYVNGDEYIFVVTDKHNDNFISKDIYNQGGVLTTYIEKQYGIKTPTLYERRMYYMRSGNYWWEQWLTYTKIQKQTIKKCPYCNWDTIDIENKSGAFEQHLLKVHNITKADYLKEHPEDKPYFILANPSLNVKLFETNPNKYVTCKVCNQKMAFVNSNHLATHGMTSADYIKKFGIGGNICPELHNRMSENTRQTNINMNNHPISSCEKEIIEYIKNLGFNCISDRKILNGKELDIYVPEKNVAFEYDGLYWHCELYKDKSYHVNKTEECLKQNVKLYHIFEDEWQYKKEIVKSRIANILGVTETVIYARKCDIKIVPSHEANEFLAANHLQGKSVSSIRYGLYYNKELVSLMTFGKQRVINKRTKQHGCELLRFCNKMNTVVVGGASKLLHMFIKEFNPDSIISYADRRWSNGNVYEKLGFSLFNISSPSYYYVLNNKRIFRYNLRKDILVSKYGCPPEMTEHDFCKAMKLYRIYDCGCLCYKMDRDN